MILMIHQYDQVVSVRDLNNLKELSLVDTQVNKAICQLAKNFPDRWIIWVRQDYEQYLNLEALRDVFHHKGLIVSYAVASQYLPEQIGYVDQSCFIKVNREVCYPTWLMSADAGGMHAELITEFQMHFDISHQLDYSLNSLAKTYIQHGLFCYSNPLLILSIPPENKLSGHMPVRSLFGFVRQHYRLKWLFMLFYFFLKYEKKVPLWSLISHLLSSKRVNRKDVKVPSEVKSSRTVGNSQNYDVVIPTLGRKTHLYNYLKDLSGQLMRPNQVIIVEQNPDKDSQSELDYLDSESWPFQIKHHFIHQLGACNARNLAFKDTRSEWVVLGDDDIRVNPDLYPGMIDQAIKYGVKSVIGHCPEPGKTNLFPEVGQTTIFGSGLAVIHRSLLKKVSFDLAYEFGYGEDNDFGMQIRNSGEDVLYLPNSEITHLKVSSGGFRTPFEHPWNEERVKPKPSPTVMLNKKKYLTTEQRRAYRFILWMDVLKGSFRRLNFRPWFQFATAWKTSDKWADHLLQRSEKV